MRHFVRSWAHSFWKSTDSVTKWIQVIALCVAGWWTFTNFLVADKPSLEPNLSIKAELKVDRKDFLPDTCLAQYTIIIKNEGKISFDVKDIHFYAWSDELPEPQPGQEATFWDVQEVSKGTKIVDQQIDNAYLYRHYSPGQELKQDFNWIVRRQKTPKVMAFVVDVTALSGKKTTVVHARGVKDHVCLQD